MTNPQHPAPQPGQHPGQQYDPQQAPFGYTQQPGPHGYAQQPGGQPPHPGQQAKAKRKKPLWKRWWFWLLAVIALIVIISSASGGGDSAEDAGASADSGTSDEADTGTSGEEAAGDEGEAPAEAASEYSIGDAVATGDWEVTVNDVESGVSELGDEYLGTTAQGQFILVEMSVANTGSEPSFFFESDVSLLDADGNTYSPDSEAGIYAATDNDVMLLEEINPGNTATGVIVYDVPADVSPNVLEFQGGIFDEAATVALD
ncbi:MAG: DUF4352 domain-containing protein [Brevibacterium yomogidense]|uniref:DUF4352 domain-containing protein n=1 Tax=Brevibacterium sp. Mu109 TaxID=1255669 RepID=UPI000C406BE4|nr:DUF4352 domain-containing protein [Brevibacterium sp. Mu109]SMX89304.1 protein of unknown function (DUF4352) [Brevibacterium sp. Mu109]